MSYQKKYYFQFTSLDDKVNVVELWQNTANVLVAEEVKSMAMPFSVEMPELDHKFQVVRGTGCEINLLSATDGYFFDGLYHSDMKEFMVKHYIDSTLNWLGYLNGEMVRESYSESVNYPFQVTGNDGFALLERLHFCTLAGDKYTGIKSMFDIIQIILTRIGLPYEYLFINLSTTFTGQGTASDSTILHETYIDCSNFYNEDDEPETMRKVLDGILAPFGAFITQVAGSIYITDIHTLAAAQGDSVIYKKYSFTGGNLSGTVVNTTPSSVGVKQVDTITLSGTGGQSDIECMSVIQPCTFDTSLTQTALNFVAWYQGVYPVDLSSDGADIIFTAQVAGEAFDHPTISNVVKNIGYIESVMVYPIADIPDIGYMGTGSEKERSGGRNKQVVTYSPYPKKNLVPTILKDVNEFTTVPADYSTSGDHTYKTLSGNATIEALAPAMFETGYDTINGVKGEERVYLRWLRQATKTKIAQLKINPDLAIGKVQDLSTPEKRILRGAGMIISGDVYVRSTDTSITEVWLNIDIRVGSLHASSGSPIDGWVASHTDYDPHIISQDKDGIVDKWVKINDGPSFSYYMIPVGVDLSGSMFVDIYSNVYAIKNNGWNGDDNPAYITEVRLSNLAISFVDIQTGSEISDNDIEYWGYLDRTFKEEAEKVSLICGTDAAIADRGKMMKKSTGSYSSITEWTRAGQSYKIEELLLNSISSNYRFGYLSLNNLKLQDKFSQLTVITDEGQITSKWFMVKGMKKNFRDNTVECSLTEISPDSLTIVK